MARAIAPASDRPAALDRDDEAADDRAEQDRDERPHFDQAVAADELFGLQRLRQDRVLDRTEQRRMHAQERQRGEQQREVAPPEAGETDHHDGDLEELDPADEPRLLELVGELSRRRRQEHERRDEHRARDVDERVRVERWSGTPRGTRRRSPARSCRRCRCPRPGTASRRTGRNGVRPGDRTDSVDASLRLHSCGIPGIAPAA